MTISLLDEGGAATMVWTLTQAWPVAVTSSDLSSDGNEVAIESLELAYETVVITAN